MDKDVDLFMAQTRHRRLQLVLLNAAMKVSVGSYLEQSAAAIFPESAERHEDSPFSETKECTEL